MSERVTVADIDSVAAVDAVAIEAEAKDDCDEVIDTVGDCLADDDGRADLDPLFEAVSDIVTGFDKDFTAVIEFKIVIEIKAVGVTDIELDGEGIDDSVGILDTDDVTVGVGESVGIEGLADLVADVVCVIEAVIRGEADTEALDETVTSAERVKVGKLDKVAATEDVSETFFVGMPLSLMVPDVTGVSVESTVVDNVASGDTVSADVSLLKDEADTLDEADREARDDVDSRAVDDVDCVAEGTLDRLGLLFPDNDAGALRDTLVDGDWLRVIELEVDCRGDIEGSRDVAALEDGETLATDRDGDGECVLEIDARMDCDSVPLVVGTIETDSAAETVGENVRFAERLLVAVGEKSMLIDIDIVCDALVVKEDLDDGDFKCEDAALIDAILAVADIVGTAETLPPSENDSHRDAENRLVSDAETRVVADVRGLKDVDTERLETKVADMEGEYVALLVGSEEIVRKDVVETL